MALMRFVAGTEVEIHGHIWRFVDEATLDGRSGWFLKRLSDGVAERFLVSDLKRLFDRGHLKRHYMAVDHTPGQREVERRKRIYVLDDLPEKDRIRRQDREEFMRRVQLRIGLSGMHAKVGTDETGKPITLLKRVLNEVSAEMREVLATKGGFERKIGQATYYRWRNLAPDVEDSRGLEGRFAARGSRNQIHPIVKKIIFFEMNQALVQARDKKGVGKVVTLTMKAVKESIEKALILEKAKAPDLFDDLTIPSNATLHRYWKQFPAFDRAVARSGMARARRDFRFIRGGFDKPAAPFEMVEFDETGLNFFSSTKCSEYLSAKRIFASPWTSPLMRWEVSILALNRLVT